MIEISGIFSLDRIGYGVHASSKKRAIELLSKLIANGTESDLNSTEVFDCLFARERLGSTGLGAGVAIPHGRFPNLNRTICAFLRLKEPVRFDAQDDQPVDLLLGLLVPENCTDEHLQILSTLTKKFSDASFREKFRVPKVSPDMLYALLTETLSAAQSPQASSSKTEPPPDR
ncbi:MAG: PTS sugar transporter subunit IIA [Gammaproteobacteria bacterium]|nr:PTS sugar transporter subunit IIA [Gammaproteobacteria bacterium]NNJ83714.1 PTS transporter subunit EIIA [Gammaproteobacteria bacterium]